MKPLDDFTLDHPIITGLRYFQVVLIVIFLALFTYLKYWIILVVGALFVMHIELTIIGLSLVYFLKRICNNSNK